MAKLQSNTRIYGTANIDSVLVVGNITPNNSTSNVTGSLQVTGGAGITGNLYAGRIVITGASNGITFVDGTTQTTAATGGGSGGSSSGYLANSVIFANTTGYLSNTSGLIFYASNNALAVTGNVTSSGVITGGGVIVTGNVTSSGVITGGGVIVTGNVTSSGVITGGGVRTTTTAGTAPVSPTVGDIWYDSSTDIIYRYNYDGTNNYWVDVSSASISGNASSSAISTGKAIAMALVFGG